MSGAAETRWIAREPDALVYQAEGAPGQTFLGADYEKVSLMPDTPTSDLTLPVKCRALAYSLGTMQEGRHFGEQSIQAQCCGLLRTCADALEQAGQYEVQRDETFGVFQQILGLDEAGDDPDDIVILAREIAKRVASLSASLDEARKAQGGAELDRFDDLLARAERSEGQATALREMVKKLVEKWRGYASGQGAIYASGIFECASDLETLLADTGETEP